jgi:hypothetical protein
MRYQSLLDSPIKSPADISQQDLTIAMLSAHATDAALASTIQSMLEPIGLTTKTNDLYEPSILDAYNLTNTLTTPTQNREGWADYLADVIFRIPPFLLGLHPTTKTQTTRLFEFAATNPYKGWAPGYNRANHSATDIFLLNPAADLVEDQHRDEFDGAVAQLQREWIAFCYGAYPGQAFEAGNTERMGPVRVIGNYGRGRDLERLADVVGEEMVTRWRAVLAMADCD